MVRERSTSRQRALSSGQGRKLGITEKLQKQKRKVNQRSFGATNPNRGPQRGGSAPKKPISPVRKLDTLPYVKRSGFSPTLPSSGGRTLSSSASQAPRTAASSTRRAPSRGMQEKLWQAKKNAQKKGISTSRGRQPGLNKEEGLRARSMKSEMMRLQRAKNKK